MPDKFGPKVFAHDAVNEDADRRIERHCQTRDDSDGGEPVLGGEAVDLSHVDLAGSIAGQRIEVSQVVGFEHVSQFLLQTGKQRVDLLFHT